jgi:hypothetical protein
LELREEVPRLLPRTGFMVKTMKTRTGKKKEENKSEEVQFKEEGGEHPGNVKRAGTRSRVSEVARGGGTFRKRLLPSTLERSGTRLEVESS